MGPYYLDTSAVIKRVQTETHGGALVAYLDSLAVGQGVFISSTLTVVEAERAFRKLAASPNWGASVSVGEAVAQATEDLGKVRLSEVVLDLARWIGPPALRTLDAIHLASAVLAGADTMVTYDKRLASAAAEVNLRVECPEDT